MRILKVPEEYPTIQAAVNAAGVNDRIQVDAGTYVESVVITAGKDGLEIRGAGGRSILDGRRRAEFGFVIQQSSSVTIRDFTIVRFTVAGIQIDTSGDVVETVAIDAAGGRSGVIVAAGTQGSLLVDIAVTGSEEAGIILNGAGTLLVDATVGQNQRDGVRIDGAGNRLFGNTIGLNGGNGVTVNSSGNLLSGNQVRRNQAAGIALGLRVTGNVVSQNRVSANQGPGVLVDPSAAGNLIVANRFDHNQPDIVAERPAEANNIFRANRCRSSIPPSICLND